MTIREIRSFVRACLGVLVTLTAVGCGSSPAGKTAEPAASYAFWPVPPDEPHIQFLGAFNSSEDVSPTQSSDLERIVFGKDSVRPAYVNKPYGVAARDGRIYVCDIRAKALVVLDLAKKQTRLVGITGSSRLERPVAVAIADDREVYVADGVHQAVLVYDRDERFDRALKVPKLKPAGLAITGDRLYVSDMTRQQVLIIDRRSGKELGAIGTVGDGDGQFRLPVGVTTDQAGNVYVVDLMRCRVQKFSPDGTFLAGVGEPGDHAGGFARPKHLAVDPDGIIYVVDSSFQNVQMFNDKFQLLMHFGAAGGFPGAMNLPVGIAVTDTGMEFLKDRVHPGFAPKRLIVVANQFGDGKIGVYALGERRPEVALAELTARSAPVSTGVGEPSAEMLRFQTIGGTEPEPESGDDPQLGAEDEPTKPAADGPAPKPDKR